MMAHATSPSLQFCNSKYTAIPDTRTTDSVTLRNTQERLDAISVVSAVSREEMLPPLVTSK